MILCWGLSAVTFILDRFRIPLLLAISTGRHRLRACPRHRPLLLHVQRKSSPDLSPAQVIRAGKPGSAVIVVAASGGGIKAAAWTTRVLTGLEESNPRIFGGSIRLISAVSGGSVGAMYFVQRVRRERRRSSLQHERFRRRRGPRRSFQPG